MEQDTRRITITVSGYGDVAAAVEALASRLREEHEQLNLLRELCEDGIDETIDTSRMVVKVEVA